MPLILIYCQITNVEEISADTVDISIYLDIMHFKGLERKFLMSKRKSPI